jgi:hypothetical protein
MRQALQRRYLVWFFDDVTVLLRLYVPGNMPQSTELTAQPRSPKRSEKKKKKKGKRKMLKES